MDAGGDGATENEMKQRSVVAVRRRGRVIRRRGRVIRRRRVAVVAAVVDVDEFEFGGGGIVVEVLVGNADRHQIRLPRRHRHAPLDIHAHGSRCEMREK